MRSRSMMVSSGFRHKSSIGFPSTRAAELEKRCADDLKSVPTRLTRNEGKTNKEAEVMLNHDKRMGSASLAI